MQKLGSNLLHIMTVIQHYFIAIVGCSSVGSSPFLLDNSGSKRNGSLEIIIESEDCNCTSEIKNWVLLRSGASVRYTAWARSREVFLWSYWMGKLDWHVTINLDRVQTSLFWRETVSTKLSVGSLVTMSIVCWRSRRKEANYRNILTKRNGIVNGSC